MSVEVVFLSRHESEQQDILEQNLVAPSCFHPLAVNGPFNSF